MLKYYSISRYICHLNTHTRKHHWQTINNTQMVVFYCVCAYRTIYPKRRVRWAPSLLNMCCFYCHYFHLFGIVVVTDASCASCSISSHLIRRWPWQLWSQISHDIRYACKYVRFHQEKEREAESEELCNDENNNNDKNQGEKNWAIYMNICMHLWNNNNYVYSGSIIIIITIYINDVYIW